MFGDNRKKFDKKIAALLIIVVLFSSFSPMFARKAEAFFFVDWVNFAVNAITSAGTHATWIKTYFLDAVAYQMINLIIERMTASTVKWINSGFKGSPMYVTNPEAYFQDIADKAAGQYIFSNPNLNFLCGPIQAKIRLALQQNYMQPRQWQCTLTQAGKNMDNFMSSFDNGGWDSFFQISQTQSMNPIGAYLQAENEMYLQIATRQGTKQQDLSWGKGFMSKTECTGSADATSDPVAYCEKKCEEDLSAAEDCAKECEKDTNPMSDEQICQNSGGIMKTTTPGSTIENKLNSVLNMGTGRLQVANGINQIITALLQQVVTQILGGVGHGLSGMSQPSTANNNLPLTSQMSTPAKDATVNTYFQQSAQSVQDISNLPPYDPEFCRNNPNDPECNPPTGSPDYCAPDDSHCITCRDNPNAPECQTPDTSTTQKLAP